MGPAALALEDPEKCNRAQKSGFNHDSGQRCYLLDIVRFGSPFDHFLYKSFQDFGRIAGLVLATWSLKRRRRQIDGIIAKNYKSNYKNCYSSLHCPIWDDASDEVILRPRRLLRSRWGDPLATASPLSLREYNPLGGLQLRAGVPWRKSPLADPPLWVPKGLFIPRGEKQLPGVALP